MRDNRSYRWATVLMVLAAAEAAGEDWPGWRGPRGDGISDDPAAPIEWSPRENIAWRVEVPGSGYSSPIVLGNAIFLTTAMGEGESARRALLRLDRLDGRVVWDREVLRAPFEGKHSKNSHASGTPAADGEQVYAAFQGGGRVHVAAIGLDGEVRWRVSPCGFRSVHGFCSSPVLHQDLVIVNCDQDSAEAAIFGLDRSTGRVRWRAERENHVRSYVPPLLFPRSPAPAGLAPPGPGLAGGRPQLIVSGSEQVSSYDPSNGRRIWSCEGPTEQCVASPVAGHGLVFITGGFPDREILAIRPDGAGDVTGTHIAWRARKGVAYVPSPLVVGDHFYVVSDETGVLSAYDARAGRLVWQERLGGKFSSSLAFAGGNIYAGSEEGVVHVVKAGGRFQLLARNDMGEGLFASPAFSRGRMYLRTTRALYAIGRVGPAGGERAASSPGALPGPIAALGAAVLGSPPPRAAGPEIHRVFDPPALPQDSRLGKRRDLNGYHPWTPITDREAWRARARKVREQVLVASGLWPLPEPAPLSPVIHSPIDRGDYTVEKAYFQSYPGFYVTGNLYRPKGGNPGTKRPGVLCPHGHWKNGRFMETGEKDAQEQVKAAKEKTLEGARYPLQARCAQLARMGCVVFHYDMVGYADSTQIAHTAGFRDAEAELRLQSAFGLLTYNSIRAFDFLSSLPEVDPRRIGVTGASGGGTQTFILCAVDDRPAAAFPAVMVSTSMQGGCVCENASLLRVGTGNIELAALCAPRPLGMTGANDWTIDIETKGLPELKALYAALDVPDRVLARCFPTFEHNYNQVSRELMYAFMNRHLGLGQAEPIEEKPFQPIPPAELKMFDDSHPRPEGAVDAAALRRALTEASDRQIAALRPRDAATLAEFRRVVGSALRAMVGTELPAPEAVESRKVGEAKEEVEGGAAFVVEKLLLGRKGSGEAVPAALVAPGKGGSAVVVAVHPAGKAGVIAGAGGAVSPLVSRLLDGNTALLAIDPFLTGEYHLPGQKTPAPGVHKDYAGYTFGYNRSLLAERVHDILTAVAYARGRFPGRKVFLLGLDRAGVWALLARALAGDAVEKTLVDLDHFRFEDVKETSDEMMLPGALKYGGISAFAGLAAPGDLWALSAPEDMETARAAYRAAGAPGRLRLGIEHMVDWLTSGEL